ncbi:MAG TPA: glycosyltransferase family 2 protein [Thermoleophilaceae bacterium]
MNLATVIVTYGNGAEIGATLRALCEQLREDDELVVLDNASADETVRVVQEAAPRARVLESPENLGFAGGCNVAAAASSAPLLLFLNPDAVPAPGCIDALRYAADARPSWGAWQALVTMDSGSRINTSGGVTHFLGMGWAGRCGESVAAAPSAPSEVDFASGAALCVRREAWEAVEGFDERYFMYGEDLDLGLRMWLSGRGVGVVPGARVEHDYEFEKGEGKWFLLERNRWWTILSDYPTALLLLLLPALLAAEAVLLVVAGRGGWLRAKLRAQASVVADLRQILHRRRDVQATRTVDASEFAERLSASLDNPYLGPAMGLRAADPIQRTYWQIVRGALRATGWNRRAGR